MTDIAQARPRVYILYLSYNNYDMILEMGENENTSIFLRREEINYERLA